MSIQKGMESYLKDKYDKDFVVKRPRLQGTGIAITGSWRAEAHPKDDKSLVFEVGRVQDEERFFDNYTKVVWKKEELPRVYEFLKSIYPSNLSKVDLSVGINTAQEPGPIDGTVPAIDVAIRKYSNKFYYRLGLEIHMDSFDGQAKSDIRSQFIKIYDFVEKKGVENMTLGIGVTVEDENATYVCSTNDFSETVSLEKMLDNCTEYPYRKGTN